MFDIDFRQKLDSINEWFKNCKHSITISESNKTEGFSGILIHGDNAYKASGTCTYSVLCDLKAMVEGTYRKK